MMVNVTSILCPANDSALTRAAVDAIAATARRVQRFVSPRLGVCASGIAEITDRSKALTAFEELNTAATSGSRTTARHLLKSQLQSDLVLPSGNQIGTRSSIRLSRLF
jgi:hypothetical protein